MNKQLSIRIFHKFFPNDIIKMVDMMKSKSQKFIGKCDKWIIPLSLLLTFSTGCEETVEPDTTSLTVTITNPVNGVTVTEPVTIRAKASDDDAVTKVEFSIDGNLIGEDDSPPYEQYWNVGYWADGELHTISAQATDISGKVSIPDLVSVTVSDTATALLELELLSPSDGESVGEIDIVTLVWRALPDAVQYEVEVSSTVDFTETEYLYSTTDTTVTTSSLSEGTHYWRIRAQNNLGNLSRWSSIRRFFNGFVTFKKTFGGSSDDRGYSVQQTSDGGYIITGYTSSFGARDGDVWLIKTDASGNEEWNRTFGRGSSNKGYSVQQTSDGGYIITGNTGPQVWLIKTDASGSEEWNERFGGSFSDRGYSVQQTSDGGFIIAGSFTDSPIINTDVLLIKTDASGNEEWHKIFGSSDDWNDGAYSVGQTPDGGYIIAGYYYSPDRREDLWLIKTNKWGDIEIIQDSRKFGGNSSDYGTSVQAFPSGGGYIITGYTASYGAGGYDVWLIAIFVGGPGWKMTFGGSSDDRGYSVQQASGGYIVTGYTESFGAGGSDVWLIKTDYSGNEEWNRTFGGTERDEGRSVQKTSDGGYIITGYTESFGAGGYDVWLIKTDAEGNVYE